MARRGFWLQSQGMAAKINRFLALFRFRNPKTLAKMGQRILRVHGKSKVSAVLKFGGAQESSRGANSLLIKRPALFQSRSSIRVMPSHNSESKRSCTCPRRKAVEYGMRRKVTMEYLGTKRSGYFASRASSTFL